MLLIGGIQKTSTVDYPLHLSCVIFTVGCNLDCFYCHNRQLIDQKSLLNEDDILKFLEKRVGLLDGVVISGGEPTLQKDLIPFIKKIKKLGFKVKLDTNGQLPNIVKNVLDENIIDYIALDLKCLAKDSNYVVSSNNYFDNVKETFNIIKESNIDYEVRTTMYPSFTIDDLKTLLKEFKGAKLWRLNYYHKPLLIKKGYEEIINSSFLTEYDIKSNLDELHKLNENIIY